MTVPGGVDSAGMPLGLQVVGRPGDDERLLAAATWVAQVLDAGEITQGRCLD